MSIDKLLDDLIFKYLNQINELGYIEAGNNGPYYDNETPVRNTAHWSIIFSYYYNKTKNDKFLKAVKKCGEFLLSEESRPKNKSFFCRIGNEKDYTNGVIGQAWVINGLISIYKVTEEEKYINVAKDVFLLHSFNKKYKIWEKVNLSGETIGFDYTFNHQLWFALSGVSLLSILDDDQISYQCKMFFNNIKKIISTYHNGLIKHRINITFNMKDKIKNLIQSNLIINMYNKLSHKKNMLYKENGYHLFNLYAFAMLYNLKWDISYFNTRIFRKSLKYCFNPELYNWLENKSIDYDINKMSTVKYNAINIYGFPYNAPGFELPYIYNIFSNILDDKSRFVKEVIEKQIKYTYNDNKKSFCYNTEDEITLNSRIYEYVQMYI